MDAKNYKLSKQELEHLSIRYHKAYDANLRFINLLIRGTHLCAPLSDGLNVLYGFDDTGKNVNANIYNSTPKLASNMRANKLHSTLCPINKRWSSVYSFDDQSGSDVYQDILTDSIFNAIDKSNLHSVLKSFFLDLNMGCAALFVDSPSDDRPIVFRNISGITLMPEYSDDPMNKNCWWRRCINWYELNEINPNIAKEYSKDEKEFFISCGFLEWGDKYLYIEVIDDDFEEPLRCEIRPFNQLILVNETLRPGEARGHGVILQILEDIERLNNLTRDWMKYTSYMFDPALMTGENVPPNLGQMKGLVLPMALAEGSPAVQSLTWQADVQNGMIAIRELEDKIKLYFNVMPLGQVNQTPVRTATEVAQRTAEEERQSVADLSRVANELLRGMMSTVFEILVMRGTIKVDKKKKIEFKFDSPEVDIQNNEDLNALLQGSEILDQLFGKEYTAMLNRPIATSEFIYDKLKIPKELLRSNKELVQFNKNIQQQMQQQAPQPLGQQAPQAINPTQLGQNQSVGGFGF